MENFVNDQIRLAVFDWFMCFVWVFIIPHIIFSLYVLYDFIKTKRNKDKEK